MVPAAGSVRGHEERLLAGSDYLHDDGVVERDEATQHLGFVDVDHGPVAESDVAGVHQALAEDLAGLPAGAAPQACCGEDQAGSCQRHGEQAQQADRDVPPEHGDGGRCRGWDGGAAILGQLDDAGALRGVLAGWAKARFTKADNYVVQIHRPLEEPLRSLVIAAALALDIGLKQGSQTSGSWGTCRYQ